MDKIIKNEDIKLPEGLLEKEFYICALQLKTPFWDEVNENQRGFHKYYLIFPRKSEHFEELVVG